MVVVELDAVEDRRAAVHDGDVAEVEIAVAFAHESPVAAPRHRGGAGGMLAACPRHQRFEVRELRPAASQRSDLREVLQRDAEDDVGRAEVAARTCRGGGPWNVATRAASASIVCRRQLTARERVARERLLRELAHPHRVVDDRTAAAEFGRVDRARDRDDVEVDVGREPPVEAKLLVAIEPPRRQRPEVEKPERRPPS